MIQEEDPLIETTSKPGVSTSKTALIIVKSFVASGVLFLPNSFRLGGILFSSLSLVFIAFISTVAMIFLVQAKHAVGGTFGEIGGKAYGGIARTCVEGSLIASQLGFCAAYLVFVAELSQQFGAVVTDCSPGFVSIPFAVFIAIQFIIYAPLVWIRNMANFAIPSLIADLFIGIGLVVVSYFAAHSIATNGVQTPALFAPTFPMFIGTAVYTFEGIGLIIPIEGAMANPKHFPALLSAIMGALLVIFVGFSSLCYLAFGDDIQTIVLLNMPSNGGSATVLFLYSMAVIATFPLQFFPAIRIIESKIFPRHVLFSQIDSQAGFEVNYTADTLPPEYQQGPISWTVTWKKSLLRVIIVALLAGLAIIGSSQLESFVALIGALCCVPLAFIYPALFHFKLVAQSKLAKAIDIGIVSFGVAALFGTTAITLYTWITQISEPFDPCRNHTNHTNHTELSW